MTTTTEEIKQEEAVKDTAEEAVVKRPRAKQSYRLKNYRSFSGEIAGASGEPINNCYQCKKCSNGCPVTYAMDYQPHQIIKMMQLGLEEKVLASRTLWLCAACETCGTRCPNEIKLAEMFDALRQKAEKSGYRLGHKDASLFHKTFLSSVEKYGRVHEVGMMRQFMMKSGGFIGKIFSGALFKDAILGMKLFSKGKLSLTARKIKGVNDVKKILKGAGK
jgi:heterodisulfide reductase subunit C